MIAASPGLRKPAKSRVLASPAMSAATRPAPAGSLIALPAGGDSNAESASARLLALADRCVQCGLCLPACPTYLLDRTEAESPRGRIALSRAWESGIVPPSEAADRHLDHCLGCRSCEAVCPAGVAYGELLVTARARQRARRSRPLRQAAVEWLAARPRLLTPALGIYRHLFDVLPQKLRVLPRPPAYRKAVASVSTGDPASTVSLFLGCVARPYETALRDAVTRLCAKAGFAVQIPDAQTCCGALHAHAGDLATTAWLAAGNNSAFSSAGTVLTLASGCHESVSRAMHGDAAVCDAIEFLHRYAGRLAFKPVAERIALHLPCTQRNVAKSAPALRALLARMPGIQVIDLPMGYGCCGAAGTQMLLDPARADAYRRPLVEALERSGATRLLSANIGCRLHFANATSVPVQHPLEFLAAHLA